MPADATDLDPEGKPIQYEKPWEKHPEETAPNRIPPLYPPVDLKDEYKEAYKLNPSGAPRPHEVKRKKGGQPGNLNALKHGLYLDGRSVRNTTPIERAALFDINDAIAYVKDYMRHTYENGMKLTNMQMINETNRSLALAAIGLTRLIHTHAEFIATPYSSEFEAKRKSTVIDLIEHYKKKLAPWVDLSDISTDLNNEQ